MSQFCFLYPVSLHQVNGLWHVTTTLSDVWKTITCKRPVCLPVCTVPLRIFLVVHLSIFKVFHWCKTLSLQVECSQVQEDHVYLCTSYSAMEAGPEVVLKQSKFACFSSIRLISSAVFQYSVLDERFTSPAVLSFVNFVKFMSAIIVTKFQNDIIHRNQLKKKRKKDLQTSNI